MWDREKLKEAGVTKETILRNFTTNPDLEASVVKEILEVVGLDVSLIEKTTSRQHIRTEDSYPANNTIHPGVALRGEVLIFGPVEET